MSVHSQTSDFWAITSYFNPAGYTRRLTNYHAFRRWLNIPLLTVELAYGSSPELVPGDADILVQLRSTDILWQKERLLNIGVSRLPKHVRYLAWIDCDVIFPDANWVEKARNELRRFPIGQAFSELHDIPNSEDPMRLEFSRYHSYEDCWSIAYLNHIDSCDKTRDKVFASCNPICGSAWFAERSLLEKHGLYDALIIGGGDRAIACGAYGNFDSLIAKARLSETRADHYLAWAIPFFEDVQGNVGCASGPLYNQLHGDVRKRRYQDRHKGLATLGFDPTKHLALDNEQAWKWNNVSTELREYVAEYFYSRAEDSP